MNICAGGGGFLFRSSSVFEMVVDMLCFIFHSQIPTDAIFIATHSEARHLQAGRLQRCAGQCGQTETALLAGKSCPNSSSFGSPCRRFVGSRVMLRY